MTSINQSINYDILIARFTFDRYSRRSRGELQVLIALLTYRIVVYRMRQSNLPEMYDKEQHSGTLQDNTAYKILVLQHEHMCKVPILILGTIHGLG